MLTENCSKILAYLTSLPGEKPRWRHSLQSVASAVELTLEETVSAAKELEAIGYAEVHCVSTPLGNAPEGVTLTEKGINYKALKRWQTRAYWADKWIDLLALAIAIAAFVRTL